MTYMIAVPNYTSQISPQVSSLALNVFLSLLALTKAVLTSPTYLTLGN